MDYFKPLLIPTVITVIVGWAIGEINFWVAVPLIALCLDIKIKLKK